MLVPKIFKPFVSENALKTSPNGRAVSNVPTNHEKDTSSKTLVMAPVVLAFLSNLKEAWTAAGKELPQKRGVEKFLDDFGASLIIDHSASTVVLR